MSARLVVTTSANAGSAECSRAAEVARRCGAVAAPRRRSLAALLEAHDVPLAYVVGRDHESLASRSSRVFVDRGLLHARRAAGPGHPLLRALGPARRVIDGTLGLALDALHVADGLGAEVVGIEVAPALACLCEEGLTRLAREGLEAAGRIGVRQGDARDWLLRLPEADAVLLCPMFDRPRAAAPGFDLLREVASGAPLDRAWVAAAGRAAPRLVVKVPRAEPVPDWLGDVRVERGRAIDAWVVDPRLR